MSEQLGLFAPRRAVAPAVCPRVPGPLCRDGREGRCPGGARCEELGEQEAKKLRTGAMASAAEAREPPLPPAHGGEAGTGTAAVPDAAAVPNGANATEKPRPPHGCGPICQDARDGKCPGKEKCDEMGPSTPPSGGPRERTSLFHPTPEEAAASVLSDACGACGSTTGAVFYERGPLAGMRRCWPCARPVLTTMEVR